MTILALVLFTIAAAVARMPLLSRPMGTDESASFIYYASHPLWVPVTIYGSTNNHIVHSILMHISYKLFGPAEWALRLPAFLAGLAIIPLTYIAARAIGEGQRTSAVPTAGGGYRPLLAASLAAAAPVFADYSTNARGYTLLCCFALICTAAMAEIIRTRSTRATALFAISAALGFYTVPVMLYPFVFLIAWGRRKAIRAALIAVALTFFLYAPILIVSGLGSMISIPYERHQLPLGSFLRALPSSAVTVWSHLFAGVPLPVQILVAIGFVIAVRCYPMWLGFIPVTLIVVLQRVLPLPRVWLPFLLLFFITAAAAWPWSRSEPAVALAVFVALTITGMASTRLPETGELRAVREIARELNRRADQGDPVLALPPSELPLAFYCHRVEALNPDLSRPRLFVVENRDYGATLPKTLAFFKIDPRRYTIWRVRDFGSAALYELRR